MHAVPRLLKSETAALTGPFQKKTAPLLQSFEDALRRLGVAEKTAQALARGLFHEPGLLCVRYEDLALALQGAASAHALSITPRTRLVLEPSKARALSGCLLFARAGAGHTLADLHAFADTVRAQLEKHGAPKRAPLVLAAAPAPENTGLCATLLLAYKPSHPR